MFNLLINNNIQELAAAIADSEQAVPAGGTTIASSALLAISLLELVIKVSEKEFTGSEKNKFKSAKIKLKNYQKILTRAIDADVAAYQKNLKKGFVNSDDLIELIDIPLDIAESCYNALKIAQEISNEIKESVKADHKISIYNLKAGIRSAILIIETNFVFFPEDSLYLTKVKKKIKRFKTSNI